MKKQAAILSATMFILSATVSAGSTIGSISSMGPVEIDGSQLSASTVPTWPIANGDEIRTTKNAAVIFLKDKSRITVTPNSKVRLKQTGEAVAVYLLDGSVFYSLQSRSSALFQVAASGNPVFMGMQGSLSVPGASTTPGSLPASSPALSPDQIKFAASQMTVSRRPAPSNVNPF